MTKTYTQALEELQAYIVRWHYDTETGGSRPADGNGRNPPPLIGNPPAPTLNNILSDLSTALVDPDTNLQQKQREVGLTSIIAFLLSWRPGVYEDKFVQFFRVSDLTNLNEILKNL